MPLAIRPATPADAPALSRICLLTADADADAAPLHAHPALPGLVWALPYVCLPEHTWGFVLVDEEQDQDPARGPDEPDRTHAVLGYILGATDTRALEAQAEAEWWPALREKYPLPADTPPPAEDPSLPPLSPAYDPVNPGPSPARTPADAHYVALLHSGWAPAPAACVRLGPAHMHIDLLPAAQRQGWGRRLVAAAVRHLRAAARADVHAVWLGMDPRNAGARAFYERLGFRVVEGAPGNYLGLRFDEWEG